MRDLLLSVLSYAWIPALATIVGSVVATFRPPTAHVRGMVQHFAAGVVFSVVAVELLPDVVKEHRPIQVVIGFAAGVLVMLGIKAVTAHSETVDPDVADARHSEVGGAKGKNKTSLPIAMLVGVGVDVLVDGFLIGLGFAAGAKEGKLLTIALTIELLSLGLAVSATLSLRGFSRGRAILITSCLALLIAVGATIGPTLLHGLSESMLEVVLSFGLAALLYLVTEELLAEAHEEPETPLTTATFFLGFLLFLILGMTA